MNELHHQFKKKDKFNAKQDNLRMNVALDQSIILEKISTGKKRFLSGIARMMGGGGLPMPEFFGPFFHHVFPYILT